MSEVESNIAKEASDYFGGAGRAELLKCAIQFAVSPKQSAMVFYGPGGIGKSLLLNRMQRHLSAYRYVTVLDCFFQSPSDFFRQLCAAVGVEVHWNQSELDLRAALRSHFSRRERPTLLLIDNAHEASANTLSAIIDFVSGFEQVKAVLAVDTFGSETLSEDIRQFGVPAIAIRPIARPAIKSYLKFEMPDVYFSPDQVAEIYRLSEGVPERINAAARYTAAGLTPKNFDPQAELENIGLWRRLLPAPVYARFARQWSPGITAGIGAAAIGVAASVAVANSVLLMPRDDARRAVSHESVLAVSKAPETTLTTHADLLTGESAAQLQALRPIHKTAAKPVVWEDFSAQIPEKLVPVSAVANPIVKEAQASAVLHLTGGIYDGLSEQEMALLEEDSSSFVLQFMAGDSEKDMQRFIRRYEQLQMRVYRTVAQGRIIFKAISQSYAQRDEAIRQINALPVQLRKNPPWIRGLAGVQRELLKVANAGDALQLSSVRTQTTGLGVY